MQLALMHVTASTTSLNAITDATREAVADKPAAAHVVFTASAQPEGPVGSQISLGKYRVHVDEPPSLGGQNTAPNPVEYYLASLLSCQVVTYRFWAERLGIQVDSLSASAEGDLDVRGFFGLDDTVTVTRLSADPGDGDGRRSRHRCAVPGTTGSRRCPLPRTRSDHRDDTGPHHTDYPGAAVDHWRAS